MTADPLRAYALSPPALAGAALGHGRLRVTDEDFVVTEELGFEPGATGAHFYLEVTKRNATTSWAARALSRALGVAERDIGYSGLKDRHAVTTQWFSVPAERNIEPQPGAVADGIDIVRVAAAPKKLRRGVHKANAFRLVVRDVDAAADKLAERLGAIRDQGFPNYFGVQRFGRSGNNLVLAKRLAGGARLPRRDREFAISAARSALFNAFVAIRIGAGRWQEWQHGDRAMLAGSRSHFSVDPFDPALAQRYASGDIHPGATLWGRQGTLLAEAAGDAEAGAVAALGAELGSALERGRAESMLRPVRARPSELTWQHDPVAKTLTLEFTLERGSFATALLNELLVVDDQSSSNT